MADTVFCKKLKRELPGLAHPPVPGELGRRIQENISAEAWKMFEEHFKMLVNEMRLNLIDPATDEIFRREIERFLFQDIEEKPQGYVPPSS